MIRSVKYDSKLIKQIFHCIVFISLYVIFLWLIRVATVSIGSVKPLDPFPANGTFQLFNPLRRISAGEVLGQDYFSFHGILINYLYYPLFLLNGKTIFAAEISKFVTTISIEVAVICFFLFAWTRSIKKTIIGFAIYLMTFKMINSELLLFPQNSLIKVRSIWVYFFAALFILFSRKKHVSLQISVLAVSIGFAAAVSFEQGIYLTVAILMAVVLNSLLLLGIRLLKLAKVEAINKIALFHLLFKNSHTAQIKNVLRYFQILIVSLFLGLIIFFLIVFAVTGFDPTALKTTLNFGYVIIPSEQFWYFGVPPNRFIGLNQEQAHVLLSWLATKIYFLLAVGCISSVLIFLKKIPLNKGLAVTMLCFYTAFTQFTHLGFLTTSHNFASLRLAIILLAIALMYYVEKYNQKILAFLHYALKKTQQNMIVTLSAMLLSILLILQLLFHHALTAHRLVRAIATEAQLSPYWHAWQRDMESIISSRQLTTDASTHPLLWSTYASFLESDLGVFQPSGFDYMIHALGPYRSEYNQVFKQQKPTFVHTYKEYFDGTGILWVYEEWLQTTNWPFWEELLLWYDPIAEIKHSILWQRREQPRTMVEYQPAKEFISIDVVSDNHYALNVATDSAGVTLVDIDYSTHGFTQRLPVLKSLTRFLVSIDGTYNDIPVSLSPHQDTATIPVFHNPEQGLNQDLNVVFESKSPLFMLPSATLTLDSISYRWLPLSEEVLPAVVTQLEEELEWEK